MVLKSWDEAAIMSSAAQYQPVSFDYPTSDGRPMAETDIHRELMIDTIGTLQDFYADEPMVYVSGNLLVFYERGDRLRHVSPDTFVVKGVPKHQRDNYLIWEEAHSLDVVFEFTSKTTRLEDRDVKFELYEKRLKVREYFLFDPLGDYLTPPLQGYRLRQDKFVPIRAVKGRFPSQVLGLHIERAGAALRFYHPPSGQFLPTRGEKLELTTEKLELTTEKLAAAEAENARLRHELEALRRRSSKP
jgi:Uma2 family endonuclease